MKKEVIPGEPLRNIEEPEDNAEGISIQPNMTTQQEEGNSADGEENAKKLPEIKIMMNKTRS